MSKKFARLQKSKWKKKIPRQQKKEWEGKQDTDHQLFINSYFQLHSQAENSLLPGLNRTMAFKHAYSVESISTRLNLATTFCNRRMSAIPATILSVGALSTCRPAADRSGPISTGKENWAALRTKSSLHPSSSKIAWSRKGRSKNVGMFLAQVTDMYNNCTADSYTDSGEGWYTSGDLPLGSSLSCLGLVSVVLGEGCAELSFVSIRLAMERKLRFLEESGDWLLFWPWYWGTGGEKRDMSLDLFESSSRSGLPRRCDLSPGLLLE